MQNNKETLEKRKRNHKRNTGETKKNMNYTCRLQSQTSHVKLRVNFKMKRWVPDPILVVRRRKQAFVLNSGDIA